MPQLTLIFAMFFFTFGCAIGYTTACKWNWLDRQERFSGLFLAFAGIALAIGCLWIAFTQ